MNIFKPLILVSAGLIGCGISPDRDVTPNWREPGDERGRRARAVRRLLPGEEARITKELNAGNDVELVSGEVYTVSVGEAIRVMVSDVTLDGQGATLRLDTSFSNHIYNPRAIHGNVHDGEARPLAHAFGIYIYRANRVTVKNLKIQRVAVDGSVVRSVAVVYSHGVLLSGLDITGDTIGPIIEIVASNDGIVTDSHVHDVRAVNESGKLDLTGAGKPNLTGILVDDVDLLDREQRSDPKFHSWRMRIVNNRIRDLTMDRSVPAGSPWHAQVDGINLQRGWQYKVLNNWVINCDEGIDTFGSCGLIQGNLIRDDVLVPGASAGIKFVHGASYNLCLENTFVNRDISTILEHSPGHGLTAAGVQHNVIALNRSEGLGRKMHRISTNRGGYNPSLNIMSGNVGGSNSVDGLANGSNYVYSPEREPIVKAADLTGDGARDVLFVYPSGETRVYNGMEAESPWELVNPWNEIKGLSDPDDVTIGDWNSDGLPDVSFEVGPRTKRVYLNRGKGRQFALGGEVGL